MKTYRLGPVVLQIPEPFLVEARHPLPWPQPHSETASAKVSLIARLPDSGEVEVEAIAILKDYKPVRGGATAYVEDVALKEGRAVVKKGDVVWFQKEDDLDEGYVGASWRAAIDTHLVTVTTTLPAGQLAVEAEVNATIESILGALKLEPQNAYLDEKLWRVVLGDSPPRDFVPRVFTSGVCDESCCICFREIREGDTYWENSTPRTLCSVCHAIFQKNG